MSMGDVAPGWPLDGDNLALVNAMFAAFSNHGHCVCPDIIQGQ
jgi:hypothetical protein